MIIYKKTEIFINFIVSYTNDSNGVMRDCERKIINKLILVCFLRVDARVLAHMGCVPKGWQPAAAAGSQQSERDGQIRIQRNAPMAQRKFSRESDAGSLN